MKNKKRFLKLAFEIVCVALVLSMLLGVLPLFAEEETEAPVEEEKPATLDIVVAAADVPVGTRLNDNHVKLVTVPNMNLPSNVITDISEVYEKYSKLDLVAGEYVSGDQLSNKRVSRVNNDLLNKDIVDTDDAYVIVTDYIKADTGEDISTLLQQLIDKNPQRTIYFPDGEYLIKTPIRTSDTPGKSTSLHLADGAVIKAHDKWSSSNGYLIDMGGNYTGTSDIVAIGSYYSIIGGTLDGNGKANGISYTAGRESLIRDVCIKNVDIGLYIPLGVNNGSSDADFEDLVIYGSGKAGSKGIFVQGHDNTFTNIRIYNTETAIHCNAGTSLYKSIYAYNDPAAMESYESTRGFYSTSWAWFTDCVAENFAVGYEFTDARCVVSDNIARWTSELCTTQIAIKLGTSYLPVSGIRAEFLAVENPVEISFLSVLNKFVCTNARVYKCNYIYEGEAEGLKDHECPLCGAKGEKAFEMIEEGKYACKTKTIGSCNYVHGALELSADTKCAKCQADVRNFKDAGDGKYTCETDHVKDGKIVNCDYVYTGDNYTAETTCPKCTAYRATANFVQLSLPLMLEACSFDESLVTNKIYEQVLLTPVISPVNEAQNND